MHGAMNNRTFYQETFSQVRSSTALRWEDMEKKQRKWRKPARRLAVAAVIALLAGISGVCYASVWFGLRDLELQDEVTVIESNGTETAVTVPTGMIRLQGYSETPEKQAAEEWQTFLNHYDSDGVILSSIGNSPTGFEVEYGFYQVYTQMHTIR